MRIDRQNVGLAYLSGSAASAAKTGNTPLHILFPATETTSSESSFHIREIKHSCLVEPLSGQTASRPPAQSRKSVRFHSEPRIREIPSLACMSRQDKKETWYRKKELKRIQDECRETAARFRKGELAGDSEDCCILGLSNDAHPFTRQRALHKSFARTLFIAEQERQRRTGHSDPMQLASKSMELLSRSRHASFVASLPKDRTPLRRGYVN